MKRLNWRKNLFAIAAWLEQETSTQREQQLLQDILCIGWHQYSWRPRVTAIRDQLSELTDRTEIEIWTMNKLWLLAQAEAKNSGVKEEDIWK